MLIKKMEEENRKIKKLNYYILLCFSIFQIIFLLFFGVMGMFSGYGKIFIHVTNWSFLMSSIYLISACICDTSVYFFSSKKLEKFNFFIRNKYSNIAFPFCFMITFGFWSILLIGLLFGFDTFTKSSTKITVRRALINLHLHFGITIMMVVELLLNPKKEVKLGYSTIIANTAIYLIYGIIVLLARFQFNYSAYVFLDDLRFIWAFLIGVAIYGLLIGCVFFYKFLANKINRKYFNSLKNEETVVGNEENEK